MAGPRKGWTRRISQAMSEDPWSGLAASTRDLVGVRIERTHPLDIYWLRAADGAPGLLFRGIDPVRVPYQLPKPRGLILEVGEGQNGLEARMYLRAPDDRDVFLTLCHDVIEWSASDETRALSTASVFRRLSHWHSLMTRARTTAMEPNEVRGLIGELRILEDLMDRHGLEAALQSWVAPDDHPQDFALDHRLIEVKTRLAGSRSSVQVSSLEQLETAHLPLFLMVLEVVRSEADGALSLNGFCDRLAVRARGHGVSVEDALQCALLKRGYIRQDAYDTDAYRVTGHTAFEVRAGFPRLVRSGVDARISQARYQVELTQIGEFEVDAKVVLD